LTDLNVYTNLEQHLGRAAKVIV